MTEEQQPKKPQIEKFTSKSGVPDIPPGIPVRRITLDRPRQLPGRQSDDSIKAETLPNGRRWSIEFVPQIRHHRISYYDDRKGHEPEIGYVYEGFVTCWWPL